MSGRPARAARRTWRCAYTIAIVFPLCAMLGGEAARGDAARHPSGGLMEINPPAPPEGAAPIAIIGARLIDGRGGEPIENAAVVVENGRIIAAGPRDRVPVPEGAAVVDAAGMTVLPGLIDAHFHSINDNPLLARFLSAGVTTLREPGHPFRFYQSLHFADRPLPRCFLVGAHLDGFPPVWPQQAVIIRDAEHARRTVYRHVDRGASGIKIYFRLPLELYPPVCEAAHERGVPVTAHLELVPADKAIEAGIDGIEHITSLGPAMAAPQAARRYYGTVEGENRARGELRYRMWADLDLDSQRARRMIRLIVERGIVLCPTLAVFERREGDEGAEDHHVRGFENMLRFTGMLHEAGATIVVGSHTWVPHAERGWAYQRELELLVEAGLSPMEAIVAGAARNARWLGAADRLGTVEPGKAADLVLVAGDPSADIRAMYEVRRVMLNGAWVQRE